MSNISRKVTVDVENIYLLPDLKIKFFAFGVVRLVKVEHYLFIKGALSILNF